MNTKFFSVVALSLMLFAGFTGCKKDDSEPEKNMAKIGAQTNATYGGFLSISEKKVYTQADAAVNQAAIDILCFYEEASDNFIALAAPGSNISGIFTGETAPEFWTTLNQTYFTLPATDITVAQFDLLVDGDAVIEGYFNAEQTSGNRKAKNMQVDDIWAFKTAAGTFGVLKVTAVEQGATGYVEFEYKIK